MKSTTSSVRRTRPSPQGKPEGQQFVATWVPDDVAERFREDCRANERSVAASLRFLIRQYVDQLGQETAAQRALNAQLADELIAAELAKAEDAAVMSQ